MLIGLFVPACDTFKANGATRIVPGSHLWGDEKPDFGPDGNKGVIDAELKKGEAFIMLGSLYHGAGNYTLPTGNRTVHIMFMCSGVHRQEVNTSMELIRLLLTVTGNSIPQLSYRGCQDLLGACEGSIGLEAVRTKLGMG